MKKTLNDLLKMRQKIDEQIRLWQDNEVIYGRVKLGFTQFRTDRPDEWYISMERILDTPRGGQPRVSIARSTDKGKCIGYIDEIIKDLQGLKQAIADKEGGKDDEDSTSGRSGMER